MKYSASTGGFYSERVHGSSIPEDAVDVPSEVYAELMAKQAEGLRIVAGEGGAPVAVEQKPAPPLNREQVEEQRLRAYADPLIGSDRYFAEAQRESLLGNAEAAEAAKALGLARFAEIQAEYPWPAE